MLQTLTSQGSPLNFRSVCFSNLSLREGMSGKGARGELETTRPRPGLLLAEGPRWGLGAPLAAAGPGQCPSCQVSGTKVFWGQLARESRHLRLSWIAATFCPEEKRLICCKIPAFSYNGSLQGETCCPLLDRAGGALCLPLPRKATVLVTQATITKIPETEWLTNNKHFSQLRSLAHRSSKCWQIQCLIHRWLSFLCALTWWRETDTLCDVI